MSEKTIDGKRKVSILATVKIPTKVRITYEVTDEEHIMPILEQILEQKKKRVVVAPPHNGSKIKAVSRPIVKKTVKLAAKRSSKN